MPRAMRVEYPGTIYHMMDCGDRREDVYVNDVDRQDLVKALAEACGRTGWQLRVYCLRLMTAQIRVDKLDIDTSEVAA